MVQILPAILATNSESYKQDIDKLNSSSSFQEGWVHIDFMDNKFVQNQSIGPEIVNEYPTTLKKEAHLMVDHPLEWIQKLKNSGFARIVFHFESKDDVLKVIDEIKRHGMEAGVALNPETDPLVLKNFLEKLDFVLVMSVIPGAQGQPFIEESVGRIEKLNALRNLGKLNFKISVDGAVKDTNAKQLINAGVDQLTCGSFILKGEVDENVEKIWEAISG